MESEQYLECIQGLKPHITKGTRYRVYTSREFEQPYIISDKGNKTYVTDLPKECFNITILEKETFKKFDSGKPVLSFPLGMRKALEAVAKVMSFGAEKYGKDNWRLAKGSDIDRYKEAALRHLVADCSGESVDPDSGNLHLEHALTSLMMYIELKDKND
jgi:hypothetical protein